VRHRPLIASGPSSGLALALALAIAGCGGSGTSTTASGTPALAAAAQPATIAARTTAVNSSSTTTTSITTTAHTTAHTTSAAPQVPKPRIVWDPIPFGPTRRAEMVAYAERHYGLHTWRLIHPHVIVIHFTETPDFQSTYNTFAPDYPDSELHELPNTCAHFVIDRAGVIHQLVALNTMCRHTVGLNWTAIGIEHVGYSDGQVLGDPREMAASLHLVRWLRCRFGISIVNVIGHNESLSSPYHHERVAALRTQTHSDFNRADMNVYRRRLARLGSCPRG
jgi:N-acetylmuramoyl-L-alanine amidase